MSFVGGEDQAKAVEGEASRARRNVPARTIAGRKGRVIFKDDPFVTLRYAEQFSIVFIQVSMPRERIVG